MHFILIFPFISFLIAQGFKIITRQKGKKFKFSDMVAYSGMPSGHSAIVISLATIIGLEQGLSSPVFAISLILALIVIRDAVGLRYYLGEHGKTLNILVKDLKDDNVLEKRYPHLLEKIGHTPMQALAGSLIGLTVSLVGHFLF